MLRLSLPYHKRNHRDWTQRVLADTVSDCNRELQQESLARPYYGITSTGSGRYGRVIRAIASRTTKLPAQTSQILILLCV